MSRTRISVVLLFTNHWPHSVWWRSISHYYFSLLAICVSYLVCEYLSWPTTNCTRGLAVNGHQSDWHLTQHFLILYRLLYCDFAIWKFHLYNTITQQGQNSSLHCQLSHGNPWMTLGLGCFYLLAGYLGIRLISLLPLMIVDRLPRKTAVTRSWQQRHHLWRYLWTMIVTLFMIFLIVTTIYTLIYVAQLQLINKFCHGRCHC